MFRRRQTELFNSSVGHSLKASMMVVNIMISSTFLTYLAALTVNMAFPCSIPEKGCICILLAKFLAAVNWLGNISVINFLPPQVQWNNQFSCTEILCYFLALVIHCWHIIVRILRAQVIEEPVSIHMLCICFFELGYVFMTLSLFAWFVNEYAQFIVILYLVQQCRIWHDQNRPAMHHIGSN